MIKRTACVVCNCREPMEHVCSFDSFPVYVGIRTSNLPDIFEKMEWGACVNCGCVQLQNLIDLNVLYQFPHNPAIGKIWETHNESLCDYLVSTGAKSILDVGGANMKLANMVCKSPSVESYTVCDLSAGVYETQQDSKIKTVKDYIENIDTKEQYDAVVLSHTLEHFYNPVQVLKSIRKMVKENGVVVISVPNIEEQLQDGFLNAMNFEHTYYISHEYMNLIAGVSEFKIICRKDFSKYNSFYTLSKSDKTNTLPINPTRARMVYENHIKSVLKDVEKINHTIQGKQVYCFGAHIFTQMLIANGLKTNNIKGILDNDENKIGKYLYGTQIKVYNPSVIAKEESPLIILRVAQYKNEIIDSLLKQNKNIIII